MSLYRRLYLPIITLLGLWLGLGLAPSSVAAPLDASGESIAASTQDTPTTLVPDGVSDFTLVGPKIFWHTKCSPIITAQNSSVGGEAISRIATYGSQVRQLFLNPVCNQQGSQILSNIAADANYVYWLSKDGLMRLSTNANVGDPAEPLSSVPGLPGEVADDDEYVYVLTHDTINHIIWRVKKSDETLQPLASTTANGKSLSTDGTYLYWLEDGNLRRFNLETSNLTTIGTGVAGYHAEKPQEVCVIICVTFHFVLYGQGNQVIQFNNFDDSANPIYTATGEGSESALIPSLTSDKDELFFLEQRNVPCQLGLICMRILLQRIPRGGGVATPLYASGDLATVITTGDLKTDDTFLFWRQAGSLLRLPNNAAALPQVNVRLTHIEVTQGIQDLNNSVSLIQNRRTFVRAYVKSDGTAVPGVSAQLFGSWSGGSGGPLPPINPSGAIITAQSTPDRSNLNDSFLFELPWSWTTKDNLTLQVTVNSNQVPLEPTYADNNQTVGPFTFEPSPRLPLVIVSFSTMVNNQLIEVDNAVQVDPAISYIRALYPLASVPGHIFDPSPGLRILVHPVFNQSIGPKYCDTTGCGDFIDTYLWSSALPNIASDLANQSPNFKNAYYYGTYRMITSDPTEQAAHGQAPVGFPYAAGSSRPTSGRGGSHAGWVAAHEIGHSLGLQHVVSPCNEGEEAYPASYPYPDGQLSDSNATFYGFDMGDPSLGIPIVAHNGLTHYDFMTYCAHAEWISDHNYNRLLNKMNKLSSAVAASHASTQTGDWLSLSGAIFATDETAEIYNLRRLSQATPSSPEAGGYSIQLVDSQGSLLADYPFAPTETDDSLVVGFNEVVPFLTGTSQVRITKINGGKILASAVITPNPPTIGNVVLQGASNPVNGPVTLAWTASDPDGDSLTFDVLYSRDNGDSFLPLQINLTGNSSQIDTSRLGGGQAIFRVIASDGANRAQADSPAFTMANKPPQPRILTPGNDTHIQWGQLVNFSGQAEDFQDGGVTDAGLVWTLGHTILGTGPLLSLTDLPVGVNEIHLRATNSAGLSASASVTVMVEDDLTLPGPILTAGPMQIGWHIAEGTTQPQTAQVTIHNGGGGGLQWTASEDAPWLTLSASSGSAPATITLTADPSGIPADTSVNTTLILTKPAGENEPAQTLDIPVTLSIGNVWASSPPETKQQIYLPIILRQ